MNIGELKKIIQDIDDNVEVKLYTDVDLEDLSELGIEPECSYYGDIDEDSLGLVSFDNNEPVFLLSTVGKIIS